jgi:hypothetical protein
MDVKDLDMPFCECGCMQKSQRMRSWKVRYRGHEIEEEVRRRNSK